MGLFCDDRRDFVGLTLLLYKGSCGSPVLLLFFFGKDVVRKE